MRHQPRAGAAGDTVLVGTGVSTIAVPAGVVMAGYARRTQPCTGTLTPLEARAIAFGDSGGARAVLVVVDLLYVTSDITERVERTIEQRTGLERQRVVVCATHTHSGASVGDPEDPVGRRVVEAACAAACTALAELRPAALWSDAVAVEGIGVNRRNGSCPPLDARVLVATEPADPTKVLAQLVEFACHPTVLEHDNLLLSPDYPGYARTQLEQLLGGTAVFVQGCAADINPVFHAHTPAAARLAGALLAGTVGTAILRGLRELAEPRYVNLSWNGAFPIALGRTLASVPGGEVTVTEATTPVAPAPPVDPESARTALAAARAAWKSAPDGAAKRRLGAELGQAWAAELRSRDALTSGMLDRMADDTAHAEVRLAVRLIRIGDSCAICALPGEVFTSSGSELRRHPAAPANLLLAGYARQSVGYLPPAREYAQSGYEVGACQFAEGAAEALMATAASLFGESASVPDGVA